MVSFTVFVFGLAIGSFLNAFMYRLEVQQGLRQISHDRAKSNVSVMRGRSFCPHCGHTLSWSDLMPLVSFVLLRGKCRYCKEKISFQYPLVELATGIIFLLLFNYQFPIFSEFSIFQFSNLFLLWIISTLLIVIFVYDLKHYLIPDKILFPAIGLAFFWRVIEVWLLNHWIGNWKLEIGNFEPLIFALFSAIGASVFFFALFLISQGKWMGFGDVKLALLMGLFLGWPNILVAMFFAFLIGAVSGFVLIALKKKGLKSEVPFAPFLIMGSAIAFFSGSKILGWYVGLFLV